MVPVTPRATFDQEASPSASLPVLLQAPPSSPLDSTPKSSSFPLPCVEQLPSFPEAWVLAGTRALGLSFSLNEVYPHISSKKAAISNIPSHCCTGFSQAWTAPALGGFFRPLRLLFLLAPFLPTVCTTETHLSLWYRQGLLFCSGNKVIW